jgi:hypothetical protein
VKRPVPWSCHAEPKLRGTSTQRKLRQRARNARGTGARKSYGWQKSVLRIARLLRRGVERPRGEQRALAGRKPEAWPDARHGWREGETVRGCAQTIKSSHAIGLWVSARRLAIRRKALSGYCPSDFHRSGDAGSFDSQVQVRRHAPQGVGHHQRIGRSESASGVPGSDKESVRGRHVPIQGPRGP